MTALAVIMTASTIRHIHLKTTKAGLACLPGHTELKHTGMSE